MHNQISHTTFFVCFCDVCVFCVRYVYVIFCDLCACCLRFSFSGRFPKETHQQCTKNAKHRKRTGNLKAHKKQKKQMQRPERFVCFCLFCLPCFCICLHYVCMFWTFKWTIAVLFCAWCLHFFHFDASLGDVFLFSSFSVHFLQHWFCIVFALFMLLCFAVSSELALMHIISLPSCRHFAAIWVPPSQVYSLFQNTWSWQRCCRLKPQDWPQFAWS